MVAMINQIIQNLFCIVRKLEMYLTTFLIFGTCEVGDFVCIWVLFLSDRTCFWNGVRNRWTLKYESLINSRSTSASLMKLVMRIYFHMRNRHIISACVLTKQHIAVAYFCINNNNTNLNLAKTPKLHVDKTRKCQKSMMYVILVLLFFFVKSLSWYGYRKWGE